MNEYKYEILESGVDIEEINDFENKIENTVNHILDEYNYEPQNKRGLINALQYSMFETLVSDSNELDIAITKMFKRFHSDFNEPASSNAVGALQVILGSSFAINFKEKNVNKDIAMLSNKILERNYNQHK